MAPPSLPQPLSRPSERPRVPGSATADEYPDREALFGLPATPASVGVARATVRELLGEWGTGDETCDNAMLVVSELVTNALTHSASDWIICRLRAFGERLHIEVEDQNRGRTHPARRQADPDDQGGRGLLLVSVVSRDWGVADSADRSGRVVWAELAPEEGEFTDTELPSASHLDRSVPRLGRRAHASWNDSTPWI
ncbi:ATP-binding protein [Streptomyces sp. NPDC002845]